MHSKIIKTYTEAISKIIKGRDSTRKGDGGKALKLESEVKHKKY